MKITILGSGTMMPKKRYSPSAFLLEADNKKILLDCGQGTINRCVEMGIDPQDIEAEFISHYHSDHAGDGFFMVHARWVDDSYNNRKNKKLIIIGPQDINARFEDWRKIFWPEQKESYPLEFIKGPRRFSLGAIDIKTFEVHHVPWFKSVGIKLSYNGKTIVYPGDIGSRHDLQYLENISKNADLLIIESGYPKLTPNHFTFKEVENLVQKSKIKKVLFVHLRPYNIKIMPDLLKDKPHFQMAFDGQIINV